MSNNNSTENMFAVSFAVSFDDDTTRILRLDAANARQEGRIDVSTAETWQMIVRNAGDTKRADVIRTVLTVIGEWSDDAPQKVDGVRTPFGNVVQRFGARYDKAVRTLKGDDNAPKPVVLRAVLSGEGGGSVTIPADHALYAQVVALIKGDN